MKKQKIIASRFEMKATIPCGPYQNIQPMIELENVDINEATKITIEHINKIMTKYGEHGPLKDNAPVKVVSSTLIKIKSFNEGIDLDFDPVTHKYSYEGKPLVSATGYTGKFYKKFDSKMISKMCSKSWGIPADEIEAMWNSNGDLAGELGTLIHKSLEHYDDYVLMGEKISAKNGKDNPAMPKHPILKNIIEALRELNPTPEKVETEVPLSWVKEGYCGTSDRIVITGEKKCRIEDYKVNINSDIEDKNSKPLPPFDSLPANKLSKYQIQLSFYANLLQKSGWEVEGLRVFVLEDEWKRFDLSVLKVI